MTLDEQYRLWAKDRSEQALNELMRGVRQRAMAISYDDDVAQEVAVTVLSKLEAFSPNDSHSFTHYVTSITTKHRLKQATRRTYDQLDEEEKISHTQDQSFISLSNMTDFHKQVATSILAGYTLKEIAEQMNLKESTLRKKLFDIRNEKRLSADCK